MTRGNVGTLQAARDAAQRRVLYLPHALAQMNHVSRLITPAEVRGVVAEGRVVEDYPDDPRGHSCLLLGFGESGRPIHVVCAPRDEYLAIITAYIPDPARWMPGFDRRRGT